MFFEVFLFATIVFNSQEKVFENFLVDYETCMSLNATEIAFQAKEGYRENSNFYLLHFQH